MPPYVPGCGTACVCEGRALCCDGDQERVVCVHVHPKATNSWKSEEEEKENEKEEELEAKAEETRRGGRKGG